MTIDIPITPAQAQAVLTWWTPGKPPDRMFTRDESDAITDLEHAIAAAIAAQMETAE